MKIRTVTVGIPDAFSLEQLQFAMDFNRRCQSRFEANGYEVQTTRVSSQVWNQISSIDQALELDRRVVELGGAIFQFRNDFSAPTANTYPSCLRLRHHLSKSHRLHISHIDYPRPTDWVGSSRSGGSRHTADCSQNG